MIKFSHHYKILALVLGFFIVSALFLMPITLGDRVFGEDDPFLYYYGAFEFLSNSLHTGESFLWNPYIYSGFPMYLSQSGGFLDPLNIAILSVFDGISGYHVRLLIGLFLGMWAMYGAGRAAGVTRGSAVIMALGYPLLFQYSSSILISNTLFLMPVLMFASLKILTKAGSVRYWYAVLGGCALGWGFIAGYAQLTVISAFLCALFTLAYLCIPFDRKVTARRFQVSLPPLLVLSLVSVFASLPALLPVLEFLPFTVRNGGLSYSAAIPVETISVFDWLRFLFPNIVPLPRLSSGIVPLYAGAAVFIGSMVTMFAIVAHWNQLSKVKNYRVAVAAFSVFALVLLITLPNSPLFYVLNHTPVFSYFRFPSRWMYVGGTFLILLGGVGIDIVRSGVLRNQLPWFIKRLGVFAALITAGCFGLALGGRFLDLIGFISLEKLGPLGAKVADGLRDWGEEFTLGNPALVITILSFSAAYYLVFRRSLRQMRDITFTVVVVVVGLVNVLSIYWLQWIQTSVPRREVMGSYSVYERIPEHERDLYRVYATDIARAPQSSSAALSLEELTKFQIASRWPNTGIYTGYSSVDGFDNFVPTPYLAALVAVGSSHGARDATPFLSHDERITRAVDNIALLSMMNVGYILSGKEIVNEQLDFIASSSASIHYEPLHLYRNSRALPRAYSAKSVQPAVGLSIQDLLDREANFYTQTYLDCLNCITGTYQSGSVTISSRRNGEYVIRATGAQPHFVVLSESFLPGWRAFLDGQEIEIVRTNGIYMSVAVPAGEHQIVFEYHGANNELNFLRQIGLIKP